MADEVPPYPQRDVLNVRMGEPRLLEDRSPSTRVVDLVPQKHGQLIVID